MIKKLLLSSLFISSLYSNELLNNDSDDIIIDYKLDVLNQEKEIQEKENTKSKYDLLNPININGGYTKSKADTLEYDSSYYEISFNQNIFQSGGIWNSIIYSNKVTSIFNKELNIQKNQLKINIFKLIKEIQLSDIEIKQQELMNDNYKIDMQIKLEQYQNGLLDISFLNDVIINYSNSKNLILGLKSQRNELIYQLKKISKNIYTDIKIEHYEFPTLEEYEQNNIINLDLEKINNKKLFNEVSLSQYLPSISLNANYKKQKTDSPIMGAGFENNYNYGIKATIPIHPNIVYNTQKNNIELLKLKTEYSEKLYDLKNYYEKVKLDNELLDEKIINYKEIINKMNELIKNTQEEYQNGFKSKNDVDTLKNTNEINKLHILKSIINKDILILQLLENMFRMN